MITFETNRHILYRYIDLTENKIQCIRHDILKDNQDIMQSKEEGKDQESIQSSTTPDPGHHIGKMTQTKKTSHTREPRG